MIFVKIKKLLDTFGSADYRGFDMENIIGGSPVYIYEEDGSVTAYFAYQDALINHPDAKEITEEEYNIVREEELERIRGEQEQNPSPEQEIQQLKLAMAEMAEAHEQEKTEMQLALAELAELVGGEANHG